MKILVIGAAGLLGSALVEQGRSRGVIAATRNDGDIRDADAVRALFLRTRPDCTILAAAYADVDGCERQPHLAMEVNFKGAAQVARAALESGSRLLYVSTDYVFDGAKNSPYEISDPPNPLSAYGRSKAAGEAAVLEILPQACIVRTARLFGNTGHCFPAAILKLAATRAEISVVDDQIGSPTFHRDLAGALLHCAETRTAGVIHATNSGACSWFDFAKAILRASGMNNVSVRAISSEESGRLAPRPKYSVLSNTSLQACGISLRSWQEALAAYLEEREAAQQAGQQHTQQPGAPDAVHPIASGAPGRPR